MLGTFSRLAPSFAFRDFRLLWVSTLLQSASFAMIWVVTGWLVFEISRLTDHGRVVFCADDDQVLRARAGDKREQSQIGWNDARCS